MLYNILEVYYSANKERGLHLHSGGPLMPTIIKVSGTRSYRM